MKYIKGYDGIRAIAIIMVFYSHISSFDFIQDTIARTRIEMICSGGTGVRLFFSLSGFLITLLLMKEKRLTGKINIKNFYIRRALKLIPPILIFYPFLILLMAFGYLQHQWIGVAISFCYLYNFVPTAFYTTELGSTWTLGVEEQFYIIWPLIISLFSNKIVRISITIIGLCWLANLYLPDIIINFKSRPHPLKNYFFINRWFLPACAPIMTGALLSYLYITNEEKFQRFFSKNAWMLLCAFLLFLLPLFIPKKLLPFVYPIQIVQSFGLSFLFIFILFNQNNFIVKILDITPLAYMGKISYGLYVYHGIFIGTGPGRLYIQQYPLNVFLTFALAILSYTFYEKPILKMKNRFSPANKAFYPAEES